MTFDLIVTISMHFYERRKSKIDDLRRREILHRLSVCLPISSNLSLLNAYKWPFVLVGFCLSGLLSYWAFVQMAFVLHSTDEYFARYETGFFLLLNFTLSNLNVKE